MSNRTTVELNHDFSPANGGQLLEWASKMQNYMRSGDKKDLPYGVTFKNMRHHSDPDPMLALFAMVIRQRVTKAQKLRQKGTSPTFQTNRIDAWVDIMNDLIAAIMKNPLPGGFSSEEFREMCGYYPKIEV